MAGNTSDSAAMTPPITVGVINYNGASCVADTINSILQSGYPEIDLVVVDDRSTDGSAELVKSQFPSARVFVQPENKGPNAARNRVLSEAKHDIAFITDNDITLGKDCLQLLAAQILSDGKVAAATPMVLDSIDKEKIYSNGAGLHFTCFGTIPLRHTKISADIDLTAHPSVCGSGGIMMVRRSAAEALGGFDENFVFGYDDGEFTYRLTGCGFTVMQEPKARIYHIEKPGRRIDRLRYQIKGRLNLILKTYSARTLFLLAPALLMFEGANLAFLSMKGAAGEWFRGVEMVLSDFNGLMERRRAFMAMKKVADKDLLSGGEIYIFPSRLGGGFMTAAKKAFEAFLGAYWAAVRPFLTK